MKVRGLGVQTGGVREGYGGREGLIPVSTALTLRAPTLGGGGVLQNHDPFGSFNSTHLSALGPSFGTHLHIGSFLGSPLGWASVGNGAPGPGVGAFCLIRGSSVTLQRILGQVGSSPDRRTNRLAPRPQVISRG